MTNDSNKNCCIINQYIISYLNNHVYYVVLTFLILYREM